MAAGPFLNVRVGVGPCLALVLALAGANQAAAQNPPPPDSLVEVLPDSLRGVFERTVRSEPQAFPARRFALGGMATEMFDCDSECVRSSTSISLVDLLSEFVPGLTTVRGGYFAGPHHLMQGPYGAGFVALYVDGREIASLERAQVDLRRISLPLVHRVRVYRAAAGVIIDVETYQHEGPAYSRIGGGTGEPQLSTLEAAFANGLSSAFLIEGGMELLDVETAGVENDRFEAMARLSWMPVSNDFGVQFEYRTESVDRAAADTADVRRQELLLRARGNLGESAQAEIYASSSKWKLNTTAVIPDEEEPERRDVDVLGGRFATALGAGRVDLSGRLSGGAAYPSFAAEARGSYPLWGFQAEAAYELANWASETASALQGAVTYTDTLLVPFTLRGFAGSGTRGFGFPALDSSGVVGFSSMGAGGEFRVGALLVSGRFAKERLDRQLGFGASWDAIVELDSAAVDLTTWEARIDAPLIPLGELMEGVSPIRLKGFFRSNTSARTLPLYVPTDISRGELSFNDTFFEDNLEVWISAYVERKGQRLLPRAGASDPLPASSYMWPGGELMIRIGSFRLFYRLANPNGTTAFDVTGALFPVNVGLFGIRWDFFN